MTDKQWDDLKAVIRGEILSPLPVGFIIDSPWLPNWYGIDILDYYSSDRLWLEANLKAIQSFPDAIFLPGFWAEYGMCSEPTAFGARPAFPQNEFPHAFPPISSPEEIALLRVPDPLQDGLGPLMLNRLKLNQPSIEEAGHKIRFSVSRGPLNIASYLMGATEFLMAMMTHPEETHLLIRKITEYLKGFHKHQATLFPSIDGILLLDDLIGFMGEEQFLEFGLPYFKELYAPPRSVKFLHNDAGCMESVRHLPEMGVNLFNMGYDTDLNLLKELTANRVAMLGNIPPRDVLASGTEAGVRESALQLLKGLDDPSRVIFSCGGGMPPGVPSGNLAIFIETVKTYKP
ncbi:MAG: uroporphyrinogen decarboxylase family protein [Bacteroidales bacterium]|nr:uroporphyrinogen decarboxylase family protein [Bacteroidales bacterium]